MLLSPVQPLSPFNFHFAPVQYPCPSPGYQQYGPFLHDTTVPPPLPFDRHSHQQYDHYNGYDNYNYRHSSPFDPALVYSFDAMPPKSSTHTHGPGRPAPPRGHTLPSSPPTPTYTPSSTNTSPSGHRRKHVRQRSQTTGTSGAAQGNEAAGGAPSRTRARRAMSNDSYNPEKDAATREIIAGQRKAPEDKKGSKHADVIDQWDLTGLGKAMWHHSGPYDAAAPSRNINAPRGPMSAFRRPGEPRPSASNSPAKADPAAPPPDVPEKPEKPEKESTRPRDEPKRIAVQRAGSSRAGGGLTGQYSSSVPSGGAYFPEVDEPTNEAELARMDRLREKEMKRRALKAAWGVDEPEPFEAFGFSPNEGPMEMDDTFSPNTQNAALPSTKPLRSPGLRLGLGSSTPPIKEGSASPTHGYFADGAGPTTGVGTGTAKPAGVKRTKSLMQRIKTMREQKTAIPFRSASPSKAAHPSSPTAEYPFPAGTASGNGSKDSSGNSSPAKKEREREAAPTMKLVTRSYPNDEGYQFADADEIPAASLNDDFVFAHSPTKTSSGAGSATTTNTNGHHRKKSSYSPSADAPPVPSVPATYGAQRSNSSNNTTAKDTERDPHRALMSRVKNLPAPPVAQVMPDFDDLMGPRGFASTGGMRSANRDPRDEDAIVEEDVPEPYSEVREKPYGGTRRKPSMVKKIKDKIVK